MSRATRSVSSLTALILDALCTESRFMAEVYPQMAQITQMKERHFQPE
jgi:hypothetical protein